MSNLHPYRRGREISLETLIFKMDGFHGAVRRVIQGWDRPFTLNQVKVELVRRYPALIPPDGQIQGILEWMVRRGRIEQLQDGSFQRITHRSRFAPVIKSARRPRKPQLELSLP